MAESHRRKMVIDKKWKESESKQKLVDKLKEEKAKMGTPEEEAKKWKQSLELLNYIKSSSHPEQLIEKEYIFDEGLGQSLKEHIDEIKTNFPEMIEVLVRRDRDGYPIVKI